MDTKQILERFETTARIYLEELNNFSLEQLTRKPAEDEWSLGQMYLHLAGLTMSMHLRNIESCRMQENAAAQEGKTEAGEEIFAAGSFPPVRFRVPASPQYTPKQPESIEEIVQGMHAVIARMREMEPTVASIPADRMVQHPRFGGLNALEWFALVEMHFRHHLMQLERLDSFLREDAAV